LDGGCWAARPLFQIKSDGVPTTRKKIIKISCVVQKRKFLSSPVKTYVRSTAEEALALILDQSFTKDQYCAIREDAKTRNADIYPHIADPRILQ